VFISTWLEHAGHHHLTQAPMHPEAIPQSEGLRPISGWSSPARGIWLATVGQMTHEVRYTDLAAEPPRWPALAALAEVPFPWPEDAVHAALTPDHKVVVRLPLASGERVYGLGLQLDGLLRSGQVLALNMDHWGTGGGRTHAPVPFYVSSRGYGVFLNTARFTKIYCGVGNRLDSPANPEPVDRNPPADEPQPGPWLALPPGDAVEAQVNAAGLEVVVIGGISMLDVVCRYNLYCGGGSLPPLWGLGFWHRVHAESDAEQTVREVADFAARGFPLDVIGLEPGWMSKSYPCTYEWQRKRFPDPTALTRELLAQGVRLNLWINPYLSPASRVHPDMLPWAGSHLVWLGLVPDYTLETPRRVLAELFSREHLDVGISGYKIDEVDGYDCWLWPDHATFPSGTPGETMRQTYGLLLQRLLYQDLFRAADRRTYGNVRASNGAASAYPFVIYSDAYDHREYLTGLSAASLCGVLWTPEARSAGSDREWLNRMQTVCFSPLAMLNAWASGEKPWSYASVADAVRAVIELRLRLLPYLYSAFAAYCFHGVPPVRAMVLESAAGGSERQFAGRVDDQANPYGLDVRVETTDQFMFGPSILVAPFYGSQATARQVELPAGVWYDFYSGARAGAAETIQVDARELGDRTPLFVRGGSLVPMLAAPVANTRAAYGADLEVRVYGGREGAFDLYEDDGTTFAYQRGAFRYRHLRVADGVLSETVSDGNGPALFGGVAVRVMG
jgi:alpha-D-xyloside xylohydrolase